MTLGKGEEFIGYFWQMTSPCNDGHFSEAHVTKINLVDPDNRLYSRGENAVFPVDGVSISVRALRGEIPYTPPGYEGYERWFLAQ